MYIITKALPFVVYCVWYVVSYCEGRFSVFNTVEQSLTCESDTRAINQEVSSPFVEREGSLPYSEEPFANITNMKGFAKTFAPVLRCETWYCSTSEQVAPSSFLVALNYT